MNMESKSRTSALPGDEFELKESQTNTEHPWATNYKEAWIKAEEEYVLLANRVVDISEQQLNSQKESKENLRKSFSKYFKRLICYQLGFLAVILLGKALIPFFTLSDQIIIVFITSVFVETLAGVIYMIIYAFNCDQEVKITEILNGVIEHFQKPRL